MKKKTSRKLRQTTLATLSLPSATASEQPSAVR